MLLTKWALKNALIPFVTQLGPLFTQLLAGSFLVELLFSLPGLGTQYVEALLNRDLFLVVGLTVFYGALLSFAQFAIDLILGFLNPYTRTS